jgi:hypothetical protein
MSAYEGVATRLKIRKSAPARTIAMLDQLYGITNPPEFKDSLLGLHNSSTLRTMLTSGAESFETWGWRVKENKGNHWVYESRAACHFGSLDLFAMLLRSIQPWLIVKDGDILARKLYTTSVREIVLCHWSMKFIESIGFEYNASFRGFSETLDDERHPTHFKYPQDQRTQILCGAISRTSRKAACEGFVPPWNTRLLDAVEKAA